MLERLKDWLALRNLHREERKARDGFVFATPETSTEDINKFGREYARIRDEIDRLKSDALLRQAERYDIPVSAPLFLGNAPVTEPWRIKIHSERDNVN